MTLSTRIEAAVAGQEREMLELAFEAVFGETVAAAQYRYGALGREPDYEKGLFPAQFRTKLNAEAWLDAAMMFLPEGYFWSITMLGDGSCFQSACEAFEGCSLKWINGKTPALALLSACLKARGL